MSDKTANTDRFDGDADLTGQSGSAARLGIIISMFPELHETFILRELAALERKGVDFTIYSLQFPRDPITLVDAIRLSEERTVYSSLINAKTIAAFFKVMFSRPRALGRTLFRLLINGYDRPLDIFKALAILPVSLHFAEHAQKQNITHVHGHWANIPTTACWYLQQIYGFTWSAAIHGEDIFSPNRFLPYKLDQAAFTVVCSGFFCNHLQKEIGVELPNQIHLNYHGLDPRVMTFAAENMRKPRSSADPLKLVSIGRLVPTKGHDTLLKALADLRDRYQVEFMLDLIGSGPDEQTLRDLTKSLSLDECVNFQGALKFDDVLRKLIEADAFCLAPRLIPGHPPDGIPNVIAEAMALGVPVVTTRVSAIPELVEDGVTGLLVAVDDYNAFADALAQLGQDSQLVEHLSNGAYQKVGELFNQDKNIDELLAFFESYTGTKWQSADPE